MFVVLGASGNTGSAAAQRLLDEKRPVRVVVRDAAKGEAWRKQGAEVAVADVEDPASLTRAFNGASGVYALLPPDVTAKDALARNARIADHIAAAAKDAKVPHLVLLSSIGAQHASGTGPIRAVHYAEKVLRESGVRSTFLRAPSFMENNAAARDAILHKQILPTFHDPSFAFPMAATKDVGRAAAQALLEGASAPSIIELEGPQSYSVGDVARAFSAALKKTITPVFVPLSEVIPTFTSMGVSENVAALFKEMFEGIASGRVAHEGGGARRVRGTIDVETFARELFAGQV